tara:strand:- start:200 stop:772 length:573 start_codon:yes stop_codon:yes gene_type:complete
MNYIEEQINTHLNLINKQKKEILLKIEIFSKLLIKVIKENKKIMVVGNGGSAADAQHLSTELSVRMKYNRIALPCLSLSTDTSALTAIGNDFNFEKIFSRQIEAIGKKSDALIVISTSGNSMNIISALKEAKKKKIKTFGILGNNGGKAKKYCDQTFIVKSKNPSRIQEIHIIFYQLFCEKIEIFFKNYK